MKKFAGFATRHPVLFGFTLIVLFSILSTLTWPISQLYPFPEGYELSEALTKVLIAACFIFLLWRFGWLKKAGVTTLGQRNIWLLAIGIGVYKAVLSVYAFTGSFEFQLPTVSLTAAVLFFTFSTSLLEETMYRGVLLTAMVKAWGNTRKGLFAAAILSGFFWASLHFFNLLVRPFPLVAMQVLEMMMVGFMYAALVLSGRSIWPAVVVHWVTNAAVSLQAAQIPNFSETNTAWGISFLVTLPLIGVGIYLFQKIDLSTRIKNQEAIGTATLTYQTALDEPHGN
jgi:membrane protease YdiL (CAAX protease family)